MQWTQVDFLDLPKLYARKATILILAIALMIFAWAGVYSQANANAATVDGISDRVEGTVEQYTGKARRIKGDLTDDLSEEVAGGLQEAKGKAKQNLGVTKNKLDDAEDFVEDKSSSLVDNVKDFFE